MGIAVKELAREWFKDPEFVAAYDALEEEFALAEALIRARAHADMTQEQVAKAMGTTQAAIARLESGRSMPSTRTLKRFAEATGTRLRVSFVPEKKTASPARPAVTNPARDSRAGRRPA
jgi:transcriptional regulator with XRE-family HTH domain